MTDYTMTQDERDDIELDLNRAIVELNTAKNHIREMTARMKTAGCEGHPVCKFEATMSIIDMMMDDLMTVSSDWREGRI